MLTWQNFTYALITPKYSYLARRHQRERTAAATPVRFATLSSSPSPRSNTSTEHCPKRS